MAGKSFSISAIFKAVDRMSNPLRGMNRNTSRFSRALRQDFAKAQRQVDRFSKNFKQKIGRGLRTAVLGIGIAAAAGLGFAGKEFVDFENTVTSASAKFGPNFQKGTEGFVRLGEVARKIGAETEFSAKAAAEGLDFLALAGFKADQSMRLLPGVVDLATAAQTDLATASDIASDSLGAFGLMTENADQLALNFTKVMDTMAKTTTTANTDLTTLFEAVKKGAASFTSAGQSMVTFNALAGKLANNGLKGAEAGTALRNVMLRLAKPTGEASDVLKQLGIQTQDSQGNFRDVIDIIGDFEKGLVGMGTAQRSAALATVFGARTVTGINLLLDTGSDKLRAYRDELNGATGAASDMAAVMRTSLSNQIATLKSAATELGFQFIEAFQTEGTSALQSLIDKVKTFDMQPVIDAFKTAIDLVKFFIPIIEILGPIILGIVAAWKIYRAALFLAAAAQTALNIAMNASPIGLVITGVGVLIGLIALMAAHWDAVGPVLKNVGKFFLTFILAPINLVIDALIGLLLLASKIPGVGLKIAPAIENIQAFQDKMNKATFSQGAFSGQDLGTGNTDETTESIAPILSAERASFSRSESIEKIQLDINDPQERTNIRRNPRSRNFQVATVNSGRF